MGIAVALGSNFSTYLTGWIIPLGMAAAGLAVWLKLLIPDFPAGSGIRFMIGLVLVMFGIYRWLASRMGTRPTDRRRFGGDRPRPWEDDED